MPAEPSGALERPRPTRLAHKAGLALVRLAERPWLALAGLVAIHWLLVLVFALTVRHNGWLFYQGGDQIWYSTTGSLLGHGELPPTRVGYGWSLLLAPIMLFVGPGYVAAIPAVIALNVLVLAPLALAAVYGIADRIAGRVFALWAAALWVAAPFLVIPFWRQDYHERFVEQFLPQALGLGALADYPSMVFLLLSAYFAVRALQEPSAHSPLLAGLLAGFAIAIKPANALFLAGPLLAFVVVRSARPLLAFGAGVAPSVLVLALWKQRGLGELPLFAYEQARLAGGTTITAIGVDRYIDLDWATFRQNTNELREWFWSARLLQWIPIAGLVAVGRRSIPVSALLGGWFGAFLLVKGSSPLSTVSSGSFFRFLIPAYPAYFLLAAALPLLVPGVPRALSERWPALPGWTPGRRAIVAAVLALVLVPTGLIATARQVTGPEKAMLVNGILTPVDDEFDIHIKADGPARELTWDTDQGASDVFYRVYRTAAGGADTSCSPNGSTSECRLELLLLGTTREGRFRDGSPPPGSVYRVGRAANWRDDPEGGDVFLISPPVRDAPPA